jgi:multidrug efflux pump subunit AcrA (membrane-fusion protein)
MALTIGLASAAERKEAAKSEKPSSPAAKPEKTLPEGSPREAGATYKVKKEPFKIEVTLKGTFEAEKMAEVSIRPEVWAALEVVKAAEHGQTVKRGDVLVQLDLEKIDEEIAELRLKRAISDLAFKQAEENLKALEASTPVDLKLAERAQKIAHEDLEKFLRADRALSEKSANFMLRSAENYLENQQEELRQLEKMYKADDLTEETEEIVLKRQRRAVEVAEHMVETARASRDDTLKVDLPRRQETLEQAAVKQDLAAAKLKISLPVALSQAQRELEKLKLDRSREEEKLKKLLADRGAMTVKAPVDGVVYYGRFTRGKWSGMEQIAESLRPKGVVMKNAVFMTVVQSRPVFVRSSVSEADVAKLRPGMKGTVQPTAFADVKLEAAVERIDAIPSAADSYEVRLGLRAEPSSVSIVPGMTCTAKIVPYAEKNAIAIPSKALFTDEVDQRQTHVFVIEGGKPKKRPVTAGKRADDRVEIVRGLAEGDEILLERPKEDEKAKADRPPDKAAKEKPPADAASKPSPKEKRAKRQKESPTTVP